MDSARPLVARFRRELYAFLVVRTFLSTLLVAGLAGGVVVLSLRFMGVGRSALAWSLLLVPVAVVVSFFVVRRRIPSHGSVRALLDSTNRTGGLLMLSETVSLGRWGGRLDGLRLPELRWDARRRVLGALLGLAFLGAGFLVPDRMFDTVRDNPLNVDRQVHDLAERIETLEQEKIVGQDEATRLRDEMERVKEKADGDDPAGTWEALDHLAGKIDRKADRAAEEALESLEKLARAETLAGALKQDAEKQDQAKGHGGDADNDAAGKENSGDGMADEVRKEAMQELARMVKDAAAADAGLDGQLPPELQQKLEKMLEQAGPGEGRQLDPQDLEKLLKAAKGCQGDLQQQLERLAEKGMIDPEMLKLAEGLEGGDEQAQADLLNFLEGLDGPPAEGQLGRLCLPGQLNVPGRGGINRGRGDAPLFMGDPSDESGTAFKEKKLPPGAVRGLKDSRLLGVSKGTPGDLPREASVVGGLEKAEAGAGSAHTQPIPPRHRGVVERYFERDGSTE